MILASALLSAALALQADTAEAWQRRGLALHLKDQYQPAIEAFEQALKRNPSLWTSRLFLGICQYRTNQFTAALASLEAAAKLAPASGPGRDELDYWLGATRIALKQQIAGLKDLERLLARQPKHKEALQLAARTYADVSSGLWNHVAERYAETAPGWLVHGRVLEAEANLEGAIDAYQQAKALRPQWPGPRLALGRLLMAQGKAAEAAAELREEVRLNPRDAETQDLLATALKLTGQAR